jgi:hypothetical protein
MDTAPPASAHRRDLAATMDPGIRRDDEQFWFTRRRGDAAVLL